MRQFDTANTLVKARLTEVARFDVLLIDSVLGVRLDGDFDLQTLLQSYFLTLFIRQGIFNANLSVKGISGIDVNLRFVGHAGVRGCNDFFDCAR
jgi:hypothetical protein